MQFYQPNNSGFPNDPFYSYTPYPYTNIIGEGDVASLMCPDGSVQFYFIPTYKRDGRFPCPNYIHTPNGPMPWPVGTEAWYIRRISNPAVPSLTQERIPYTGDIFLKSYFTTKGCTDLLPQNSYCQKFHNDNVTSTTDIHYFYPNSRQQHPKHSTFAQVELPTKCNVCSQTENIRSNSCSCTSKECKYKAKMCAYKKMIDTSSTMSIDTESQTRRKRSKNLKVKFRSPKYKEGECSCNQQEKSGGKVDKMLSTYTDKAINCVDTDSQDVQTSYSTKPKLNKSKSLMSCDSRDSSCDTCYYCIANCSSDCCE